MSERSRGWPEGYGWSEYLDGQLAVAQANRMTEILHDEIMAQIKEQEERQRALNAWVDAKVPKDIFPAIEAEKALADLEDRMPRDVFSDSAVQESFRKNPLAIGDPAGKGHPCP